MRADDFLNEGTEQRKHNALWAQITDYEKRAKATKNDIKKNHLLKMADELRAKLPVNEGEVVAFPKKHRGDISNMQSCPKCGGDTQGGKYMGHQVQVCMPCKQVYLPPNSGIDQQGNKIKEQGVAEEKTRLDPKCWTGKKIGNPKTKMKGGVRVNNCVPAESVAEEYNAEYDDEAGMAQGSLHTLQNAVEGLQQVIDSGDNLPEWCQEKISLAEDYLVTVWDYLQSEKAQGIDPELNEEFDLIESIVDRIAAQNGVDAEMVWEDLESLTEDELYAFAVTSQLNEDWSKANKSDRTDGMSRKAVKAYRRANPGSKLQTAVTTKPSKLKKGSKASKRRKSYCSRSKGQMNMHNISCAKTPDKAICKARRRWNC